MTSACIEETAGAGLDFAGDPVVYAAVERGTYSGYGNEGPIAVAIEGQGEWASFWNRHKTNEPRPDPLPRIDFGSHFVVAIVHGEEATGGHAARILTIHRVNATFTVAYELVHPGSGCGTSSAFSNPYEIVQVDRPASNPNVRFAKVDTQRPACD